MKALLVAVSIGLTVAAIWLTGKVMSPAPVVKGTESRQDPEPPASEYRQVSVKAGADVAAAHTERVYRQNLFHPGRVWIDPDLPPEVVVPGDVTPPTDLPSEADGFELVAIGRVGQRATAVITVLPAKPVPAARTRTPIAGRLPVHTPTPATAPAVAAAAAATAKNGTTKVYSLGAKIEETGYVLSKVEIESVEITHEATSKVVTLTLDKHDEASDARRKSAQNDAGMKLKQQEAAQAAAVRAAAAMAAAQGTAAGNVAANPAATAVPKVPGAPPGIPPVPSTPAAQNTSGTVNATADADKAAAERAARLEEIRDQFRKRLEERRTQTPTNP